MTSTHSHSRHKAPQVMATQQGSSTRIAATAVALLGLLALAGCSSHAPDAQESGAAQASDPAAMAQSAQSNPNIPPQVKQQLNAQAGAQPAPKQ